MNWLRLVAELRGAKPEEVATEFLRLLQNIWMDGYQYGSITTTRARALAVKARCQKKEGKNPENPAKFDNKTFVYLYPFKYTKTSL